MTIREAIAEAKRIGEWSVVSHNPTSVAVGFKNKFGKDDETELDLYEDDKESELEELWTSLCTELESDLNSITYVEAYGYIA